MHTTTVVIIPFILLKSCLIQINSFILPFCNKAYSVSDQSPIPQSKDFKLVADIAGDGMGWGVVLHACMYAYHIMSKSHASVEYYIKHNIQ